MSQTEHWDKARAVALDCAMDETLDLREMKPCRKCGGRRMRIVTWSSLSSVTVACGCRDCGETASFIHIDGGLMQFRLKEVARGPVWQDYEVPA